MQVVRFLTTGVSKFVTTEDKFNFIQGDPGYRDKGVFYSLGWKMAMVGRIGTPERAFRKSLPGESLVLW